MVGEDGRAVALGGAPDHHVQKAVRRLDVVFLEGRDGAGRSGQPSLLALLGKAAGGQPPGPVGVGRPILTAPSGRQRGGNRWSPPAQRRSAQEQCELTHVGTLRPLLQTSRWGEPPLPSRVPSH